MKILLGRKQAAECLVLPPNQKIVDVATGTGTLAYEFAKLGHSVVGIDVSTEMLNLAIKTSMNQSAQARKDEKGVGCILSWYG